MSRPRFTYANVTATLALVVAMGTGGAYAAGQITSGDIKNHTIADKDVKANSLAGAIKESGLKPYCPTGMVYVGGLCVEKVSRVATGGVTLSDDTNVCLSKGRRMASIEELAPALISGKATRNTQMVEYTYSLFYPALGGDADYSMGITTTFHIQTLNAATPPNPHAFRCVVEPRG